MMMKGWSDRFAILRRHTLLAAIVTVYACTAIWLCFRLPAFVAPNERLHYEYVALLKQTGWLPDPTTSTRPDERHQPPVYYTVAALLSSPFAAPPLDTDLLKNPYFFATHEGNHNPVVGVTPQTVPVLYASRLSSVLLGLVSLTAIYAAANQVLQRETAVLVVSLMAFQPMFLFLSAAVNNDLAVTAASSLVIAWTTVIIVRQMTRRAYFIWGVLFSVAVLTKSSAMFLGLLLPIACWTQWRSQGRFWLAVRSGLFAVLGFLPLFAGWVVINLQRNLDAIAVSNSLPPLERILSVRPSDLALIQPHLQRLWRTFLLDWSQGETGYAPDWVYLVWGVVLLVALAGWLRKPYHLRRDGLLPLMNAAWILPLYALFLAVKTLMIKEAGFLTPEGRWLLLTLPSLAWLAATGWSRWWSISRQRYAALGAIAVTAASSLALVIFFLPQLYPTGASRIVAANVPSDVLSVGIVCGGQMKLLGIKFTPFVIDQRSEVTLYWQALQPIEKNYTVSVGLVVPDPGGWKRLDWQRSYPGNGMTPTRGWAAGDVYQDRVVFYPRDELRGPTTALITIDLSDGKRAIPCTLDGAPLDVATAQETVVRPAVVLTPTSRLAMPVSFGGLLDLVGVVPVAKTDGLQVTLWWQAKAEIPKDYVVFVHLVDQQGQLLAQADSMPDADLSPTSIWQAGDVIQDTHTFSIQPPQAGKLLIGVYDRATLERLPAVQTGRSITDSAFQFSLPESSR
jgi:4-amino-4-deoxy-L-arabinose transferase-like glycosyltransferase